MDIITIEVDASVVSAIYAIITYIASVAIHMENTWIINRSALVMDQRYTIGDINVVEYCYIAGIRVVYTYVNSEFRNVRCYDGDSIVYSGSVFRGIPDGTFEPVFTKKFTDMSCGIEFTIDVWPSGCITHRCPVFDIMYNPFIYEDKTCVG